VEINVGEAGAVTVKGPKGTLTRQFHPEMKVELNDGTLTVGRASESKEHRSLHGLTRTLIANMVEGVSKGYEKTLEVHGVGYRTAVAGKNLSLSVGYSHGVELAPPPGIEFEAGVDQQSRIPFLIVRGIDKELVGRTAAQIRKLR